MAHLEREDRRRAEWLCCFFEDWADATLRRLNGRDEPCVIGDIQLPSAIEATVFIKAASIERLARLRAGDSP